MIRRWLGEGTRYDDVIPDAARMPAELLRDAGFQTIGLYRNGWSDVPVIAVETKGAASFAYSIRAGYRVELPAITSIATSLGARRICQQAFSWSKAHPIHSVVVSDRAAVAACIRFLSDHQMLVEPACGASLAAVYDSAPELDRFKSILVIVCGGSTATVEQLKQWERDLA